MEIQSTKREQEKIANDEYTASLQSIISKDIVASKYFNPDDITYPLMEKSGNYNIGGIQVDGSKGFDKTKTILEKKGMSSILNSPSTFKNKIKKGKDLIAIFQNPVSNPQEISKMRTILHEVRHKAFDEPENKNFLISRKLNEEVFNRFLDLKTFPTLKSVIKKEMDSQYKDGFEFLKSKYMPAVNEFVKSFDKKSKTLMDR